MDYICVTSLDELKKYLKGASIVAFDFETSPNDEYRNEEKCALDPHKAHIAGMSFSVSEGSAIYVPIAHKTGNNIEKPHEVMKFLKHTLFENPNVVKVAHNLAFEAIFLYANGIVIQEPVYDTIAAAQLTLKSKWEFRSLADSGLKLLATSLFGADMPDFQTVTGGRYFDELDPQNYETIRYACADSDYTLRLYHRFNDWFDRFLPKHRWIVENIESPTAVFVGIMEYNGVRVDKALMYQKQFEAEEEIAKLTRQIKSFVGNDIEIGANASTDALKKYLYEELNLPVVKTTAKFQVAADEEAIILLKDWCKGHRADVLPLLEAIHDYRKWNKIKSTYIDGFLNAVNDETGRIHTSFFPLGTGTGRFASRYPNLQNLPRRDNDPVGIRDFLIPSEGHIFIDFDFSQIELRVGAWYCRDEKMLEVYKNDGDIHSQTTSVVYNIPFDEAANKDNPRYKERRSIAKNCNFGVFYGLFANGLMRNLKKAGIEKNKAECEKIIQNLKNGYPKLTEWQKAAKYQAGNCGYSETALGRRRMLPGIYSPDWSVKSYWERCSLNTPIQGTAADILKLAMVRILAGLKEYPYLKPLLTIHDEILFEVPIDKKDEACLYIKSCMEQSPFPEFDVPIKAEGATGYSFGRLEEI
jgi:DNA polymerase-1